MLTGYAEAHRLGAEIVVKMDGDGQMDPAQLPALIAPIVRGEADYAKGNRYLHARQLRSMPLLRRLGNLGLSFLTKLASGYWNIFDPTNGYTAIHAALIPLLNKEDIGRRYFFESSMLLELSLLRAVVRDVYIPARYGDETSHLSILKTLRQFPPALAEGVLPPHLDPVFRPRFQHRLALRDRRAGAAALGRGVRGDPLGMAAQDGSRHAHRHRDAGRAAGVVGHPVAVAGRQPRHPESADALPAPR